MTSQSADPWGFLDEIPLESWFNVPQIFDFELGHNDDQDLQLPVIRLPLHLSASAEFFPPEPEQKRSTHVQVRIT